MKFPTVITKFLQRRARKKYEREKALRAQQDENAIDRVADAAKTIGGGGSISGSN